MPGKHCRKLFTGVMTSLCVMSALLMSSAQAFAQEGGGAPAESGLFRLDIGIGLKGGLTGAWALEVPENPAHKFNDETKSYYAAFGLGGDFGLMLDARALGIVGIETGLRFSFDNAEGYNELKQAGNDAILFRVNQEQRSTSMRIPLLLKLSV